MNAAAPVFLSAPGTSLGAPVACDTLGARPGLESLIAAGGFRQFLRADKPLKDLAGEALVRGLDAWGGDRAAIDLLIYCSTRFRPGDGDLIAEVARTAGLGHTPLLAVGFSGCANLLAALSTARGLIRSEGLACVAILTADAAETEADRFAAQDYAVLSDGAAACVVSASPERASFRIEGLSVTGDNRLRALDLAGETPRVALMTAKGVRKAVSGALSQAGLGPAAARSLVCSNIRRDVLEFYVEQCRLTPADLYDGSFASLGHCFAADPLLNLEAAQPWLRDRGGDGRCLVLGLSPYKWGALVAAPIRATGL